MTRSKTYQESDPFKRKLLREIYAGNRLLKRGWPKEELPADVHTLESVVEWYDKISKKQGWDWPD
jgi:hypothetical protein